MQTLTVDQWMDRLLKIDTNGLGVITFSGHGGSTAASAVDDVMPTAYGESFDILSAANEAKCCNWN